jgi:bacillithiol system protein YtxJ
MKSRTVLNEIEDWEKLRNENNGKSVVILKYSPFCSVSRGIERVINKWVSDMPETSPFILAEVDVVSSREVSRAIADDLHIRHESPQVIILDKDGKAVWHESHYFISIENIEERLNRLNE